MSNAALIADILAGNRVIDRKKRMEETVDVMCNNMQRKIDLQANSGREYDAAAARGYGLGNGRKQGD